MGKFDLVIRFKNLGADDSVKEHQTVIDNEGYTWGGWWAHSDEFLPIEKISTLRSIAQDEGITLLLVNSEKNIIYPVTVTDLKFSHDKEKINSPDKSKTPKYYKEYSLLLWFKMTAIQPSINHDSVICQYSYCDYFDYKTSEQYDYSSYDKKIVSKIKEFSAQPRTIFFIRETIAGDSDFDVNLSHSSLKEKNIAKEYSQVGGNSILLLSDLHFSEKKEYFAFNECKLKSEHSTKSLSESVKEVCASKDIASAIVAGDLTWCGSREEFAYAEQFIFGLVNHFQINRKLITIVPGNHDIIFNENEYKDKDKVEIGFADEKSKLNYVHFYKQIYDTKPNEYLAIGKKIILKNRLPIDIVGINSNCLQQNKNHFRGMGFVGHKQLNMIEQEMNWDEDSYAFKILVLHHHIHPVEYIEEPALDYMYSMSLDAGLLSSFIVKNKINLVVHGHKHKEHFLQIGSTTQENNLYHYNILGLGSTSSTNLAQNTLNSLAVLDFNKRGYVTIKIIQLNNSNNDKQKILFEQQLPVNWKPPNH
jgi:3',5'-cyclic AMP phosphodiesterase CpdA